MHASNQALIYRQEPMPSTLRIQLLGEFRLFLDNEPIDGPHLSRLQALLAYLALYRHAPQSRRQIATIFWLDSSEKQANTNLRKLIHQIRQLLPTIESFLLVDYHTIGWRTDADLTVDVDELEQVLDSIQKTITSGARVDPAIVDQVIALYHGELLSTCYEDWLLSLRQTLHERVVNTLTAVLGKLETQHDYETGIHCAKHLLRLDPLHEPPYRHLMHFRALTGDRAGALRVYHECARILEQELGVSPSAETQAIYEHLLQVEPQQAPLPSEPQPMHLPLVGRQSEWQILQESWRSVASRGAHLVMVWGEAGVGKTRLIEELLHWAKLRPGSTALGRAFAAEGALAYAPITEWLRSPALQPALSKLSPLWQTELARLVPELLIEHPNLTAPGPLTDGWQRQRFHEALGRAIWAASPPQLLVLDDMQWCDEETLSWLRYLLRLDEHAPLLIVGTARTGTVEADHPLHALLHQLHRTEQCTEIELMPLSAAETTTLASQVANEDMSAWATQLYQETEGNPLFVVETVRAGVITGPIKTGTKEQGEQGTTLTPTVQAVIKARLAQLSPSAHQLLQVAAAIGRVFTVEILAAVGEAAEGSLVQDLDELWRRRIVREQGEGYDFSHDKIREAAYSEVAPMRRRLLHRRIAEVLERLHAANLDEIYGTLAAHLDRAGETNRAIVYSLRAGEHALAGYAPQQALRHFARVLTLTNDATARARAYFGLGRAYFDLDNLEEAIAQTSQAVPLIGELDPRRPKILYFLGEVWSARFVAEPAQAYAQAALKAAEALQDHETICQCLSLLGQICSARGELDAEVDLISRALQICREVGNRWREGRTLADLAFLQAQRGQFAGAVIAAEQAIEYLEATDDQAAIAFAWNMLGRAHGGQGNYMQAIAAFQCSGDLAEAIDHKALAAQIPNMLGWLHQQLCDYQGALALDTAGVELAQKSNKFTIEISARINVALDTLYLGAPGEALAQLHSLQQTIEQAAFDYHGWRWRLRLCDAQGACYLALNQPHQALALAEQGQSMAKATSSQKYIAASHALKGMALAQLGQLDQAIAELQAAVLLADQIGHQPLRWQGRLHLAQFCNTRGQAGTAKMWHAEAVQIIHSIAGSLTDLTLRDLFLNAAPVQNILQALEATEAK